MKTEPPKTKLAEIRELIAAGNWKAAMKLAAGFGGPGPNKTAIEQAYGAYTRPDFYREIGKDPGQMILAGMTALVARYGDPEKNFRDAEYK
jgi:hypothetical protein